MDSYLVNYDDSDLNAALNGIKRLDWAELELSQYPIYKYLAVGLALGCGVFSVLVDLLFSITWNGGVFHVKPCSFTCGMGFGFQFKSQKLYQCLCFGCACGQLEEEEGVDHHVQVTSFGNKFHIGDCCTCIRPVVKYQIYQFSNLELQPMFAMV